MATKPDAVLIPPEFADSYGRDELTAQIKTLMGGTTWYGRDGATGLSFGRLKPEDTRMHPHGSKLEGSSRYTWYSHAPGSWAPVAIADINDFDHAGMLLGYLAGNEPILTLPTSEPIPDVS